MKMTYCTIVSLTTLALTLAHAQPVPSLPPRPPQPPSMGGGGRGGSAESAPLTTFNLDFPGGTPKQLVAAIVKATGRPLNAIILNEYADTELPALKMNGVDVVQLFAALEAASHKTETYPTSNYRGPGGGYDVGLRYQTSVTSYGFKTEGHPSDGSIWHFYVNRPQALAVPFPKTCRLYSLAPYLDRGVSVDDITTAIETGWKMLGDTSPPTISFHKDTKLLIAVGQIEQLDIIDAVLRALGGDKPSPGRPEGAPPATPGAKVPGKAKNAN